MSRHHPQSAYLRNLRSQMIRQVWGGEQLPPSQQEPKNEYIMLDEWESKARRDGHLHRAFLRSYAGFPLRVYVYDDQGGSAYPVTAGKDLPTIIRNTYYMLAQQGAEFVSDLQHADVAVAPLLRKKISQKQIEAPTFGTLIFHPSLLPRHRGRDAIKWAFDAGETYTGATWFWADEGYDTGDICEQEVLEIVAGESPREFYNRAVIPSAVRLLEYALTDLAHDHVRRRPQREEAATYEKPFKSVLE